MKKEFYRMVDPGVYWPEIEKLNQFPKTDLGGVPSGWSQLDQKWCAKKGECTIVYGAPNQGKTTWLLNHAMKMALNNSWKYVLWMPEEFNSVYLLRKLFKIYLGKPPQMAGKVEMIQAKAFLDLHFRFYETSKYGVNWQNWESAYTDWLRVQEFDGDGFKPDAIIFDHALMFDKTEQMHEDNVKFMMHSFNDFAADNNVHGFIVNHIANPKLYLDRETHSEYLVPQAPSKMAHGQMWERLSQNIIEVFRPKAAVYDAQVGELWLKIHKIKNEDVGEAGLVKLYYNRSENEFKEHF